MTFQTLECRIQRGLLLTHRVRMLCFLDCHSLIAVKALLAKAGSLSDQRHSEGSETYSPLPSSTRKDCMTFMSALRCECRPLLHIDTKNGRPSAGPDQRLPLAGIFLPNEKRITHHPILAREALKFRACAEFLKMRRLNTGTRHLGVF